MVFSSNLFLYLFLPLTLACAFVAPKRLENPLLLAASLLFYAWGEPLYVLLMLASIAANYGFGRWLGCVERPGQRRLVLAISVFLNIGMLAAFKYANFLADNLNVLLGALGAPALVIGTIPLPVGISFFTFQALSYVFDVYRREVEPQRSPIDLALYVSLFPQLIAGPIVRYHDVAAQLAERTTTLAGFAYGVRRFVLGLSKKVLIANAVALPADRIFGLAPEELSTGAAWLGALCYTLQIYYDFSGYSDMAIGLGHMLGFRFEENFAHPYASRSMREFWKRWHMSLSTWFRDYLYKPLGGNRGSPLATYRNLVTVFFLCGLWHGASWNFVLWGLYHGAFLVLERMGAMGWLERAPRALQHAYAFMTAFFGWVFFRAVTLEGSLSFFRALCGIGGVHAWQGASEFLTPELLIVIPIGLIAAFPALDAAQKLFASRLGAARGGARSALSLGAAAFEVLGLATLFFLCACWLAAGTHNPFIYYRF